MNFNGWVGGELRSHQHCFHCLDDQAGSFLFKLLLSKARNTKKICTHIHIQYTMGFQVILCCHEILYFNIVMKNLKTLTLFFLLSFYISLNNSVSLCERNCIFLVFGSVCRGQACERHIDLYESAFDTKGRPKKCDPLYFTQSHCVSEKSGK